MATNEQLLQALKNAPPLVREAFGSDSTANAISKIRDRYNLHIDVIGQISKDVGHLLLGFMDPVSFLESLVGKGIDRESAKAIVTDLNQEIFLPLQKKMREGASPVEDEDDDSYTEPPAFRTPPVRIHMPVPKIESTVLAVPTQSVNLMEQGYGQNDVVAAAQGQGVADTPVKPVVTPHPWQTSPASSFQTASVPYTSTPHASQPAVQAAPVEQVQLPPTPDLPNTYVPPAAPPIPQQSTPLTKEYSVDPYREPIQ